MDVIPLDGQRDGHNAPDLLGAQPGEAHRHGRTQRVANQGHRAGDTQVSDEAAQHIDIGFKSILLRVFAGVAESPQIKSKGAVMFGHLLHGGPPVTPRAKPAVNKDHRLAAADGLIMNQVVLSGRDAHAVVVRFCGGVFS